MRQTILVTEIGEKKVRWKDLFWGDIVKVKNNEAIPADLILIKANSKGFCYVETKNIDGETNLKRMEVSKDIFSIMKLNLDFKLI